VGTRAELAKTFDHLEGIRMPCAKCRADPLKTLAMHKEQKTDRQADIFVLCNKMSHTLSRSVENVLNICARGLMRHLLVLSKYGLVDLHIFP